MAINSANSTTEIAGYKSAVVTLTSLLYVVSCFLPATSIGSLGEGPALGLLHLLFGFLADLQGLPAWSSNFVLWTAMVCLVGSRYRAAAALGIMAALLGLTTLTAFKADGKYSGYYLWQSSQIVFAVGAIVVYYWSRQARLTSR